MATVDEVLARCRFLTGKRDLGRLLPGIERVLPPLTTVRQDQQERGGFPVHPSPRLAGALFDRVADEFKLFARGVDQPERSTPTARDPLVIALSDLAARCVAHGPAVGLDSVLWLHLSLMTAELINQCEGSARRLSRCIPRQEAQRGSELHGLMHLSVGDPERFVDVRVHLVEAITLRANLAMSRLRASLGDHVDSQLFDALWRRPLVSVLAPDSLYELLDLEGLFAVGDYAIERADFEELQRSCRAVARHAWERNEAGAACPLQQFLVRSFLDSHVEDRARRLTVVDPTDGGQDLASRVAWVGCLREDTLRYLAHHASAFRACDPTAPAFPPALAERLQDDAARDALVEGAVAVQRDLLSWDFFNSLRGLLVEVDLRSGTALWNGAPVTAPGILDLEGTESVYSRRRKGAVVVSDVRAFIGTVGAVFLGEEVPLEDAADVDADFAALCLLRLDALSGRFGGAGSRGIAGGLMAEEFSTVHDALDFIVLLASELRRSPRGAGLFSSWQRDPFAGRLRFGLHFGAYAELVVGQHLDRRPRTRLVGAVVARAEELATSTGESLALCSDGAAAQLLLEGGPRPLWTELSPGVRVAGHNLPAGKGIVAAWEAATGACGVLRRRGEGVLEIAALSGEELGRMVRSLRGGPQDFSFDEFENSESMVEIDVEDSLEESSWTTEDSLGEIDRAVQEHDEDFGQAGSDVDLLGGMQNDYLMDFLSEREPSRLPGITAMPGSLSGAAQEALGASRGAGPGNSLLGPLGRDFLVRIRSLEVVEAGGRGWSEAHESLDGLRVRSPVASQGRELVRVDLPDLSQRYAGYHWFAAPDRGIAVARLAEGALYDLHLFEPAPTQTGPWGVEQALEDFLRVQVRCNFLPRRGGADLGPEGLGKPHPIETGTLRRVLEYIT